MTVKYIDTLEYVKKAKEIQDPEALAEYQVNQIESVAENLGVAIDHIATDIRNVREEMNKNNTERVTKSDLALLKQEIIHTKEELKLEIIHLKKEFQQEVVSVKQEIKQDVFQIDQSLQKEINTTKQELRQENVMLQKTISELKQDVSELRKDMEAGHLGLRKDMEAGHLELRKDMVASHLELRKDMEASHLELKKDMAASHLELKTADLTLMKDMEIGFERNRREMIKFVIWTGVSVTFTLLTAFAGAVVYILQKL